MNHSLCCGGESKAATIRPSLSFVALVMLCCVTVTMAHADSESRSFCNNTGQLVNDWHVMVRGGANTLNYVTSNGLAPSYTPMTSNSSNPAGGPYNNATLTGGNVPIFGPGNCVSVTYGYNGNPGHLDWYWTNNGNQVGQVQKDGQQWFFSVSNYNPGTHHGDVIVTEVNTSTDDAHYSNFEVGTTDGDPDFGPWTVDPGQIPSPSDIYEPPTSFDVPAGGFHISSFFDVFIDLNLDAYGDISLPNESFYQMDSVNTPEPGSLILMGTGLLGLAGVIRRRVRH